MFIAVWSRENSCSYIHTTDTNCLIKEMPFGNMVKWLRSSFPVFTSIHIYTPQLLTCGHSFYIVFALFFIALPKPQSGIIWHQLQTIFTIKGMCRKGQTLNIFKTHNRLQPCRLPRQTSLSGFCCISSQW